MKLITFIPFMFIQFLHANMLNPDVPTVVDSVDLKKYAGKWYEIASYPQRFQKDCFCVTAEYTVTDKGYVKVFNSCRKGSITGKEKSITGKAFPVSGTNNAKLKVQFFWPFKADSWIIDRAADYSWAVVSGPDRRYLWILCRTPEMPDATWRMITERLTKNGFSLTKLKMMVHK